MHLLSGANAMRDTQTRTEKWDGATGSSKSIIAESQTRRLLQHYRLDRDCSAEHSGSFSLPSVDLCATTQTRPPTFPSVKEFGVVRVQSQSQALHFGGIEESSNGPKYLWHLVWPKVASADGRTVEV